MSILFGAFISSNAAAGSDTIALRDHSLADLAYNSGTAIMQWNFEQNGELFGYRTVLADVSYAPEWCDGTPINDYWVRATYSSGDSPTFGTLNTWQKITDPLVNVSWSWFIGGGAGTGVRSGTIFVEISSDSSGSPVLDSCFLTGTAESVAGPPP